MHCWTGGREVDLKGGPEHQVLHSCMCISKPANSELSGNLNGQTKFNTVCWWHSVSPEIALILF